MIGCLIATLLAPIEPLYAAESQNM